MKKELLELFGEDRLVRVDQIIEQYKESKGSLLIVLEKSHDICGYMPLPLQRYIAQRMNVTPSQVQGVVTFYSYFSTVPKGRSVVKVCTGTACYMKGAGQILKNTREYLGIKEGEVTPDGEYSVEEVLCPGVCGLAPLVIIGEQAFGLVDPEKPEDIFKQYKENCNDRPGSDKN
ncbi:MAG: NAD(P)H-dependent oxidoreductase subunit E [Deltaproteobacteria bacterium HGW-Deltaproteobacteria-10]|nr:MAG: NAD(P)H-dependent oxidoreductase subunit E [Deltaproteobacteria bacterium HGW-Deltaproteobacteria-10]